MIHEREHELYLIAVDISFIQFVIVVIINFKHYYLPNN